MQVRVKSMQASVESFHLAPTTLQSARKQIRSVVSEHCQFFRASFDGSKSAKLKER